MSRCHVGLRTTVARRTRGSRRPAQGPPPQPRRAEPMIRTTKVQSMDTAWLPSARLLVSPAATMPGDQLATGCGAGGGVPRRHDLRLDEPTKRGRWQPEGRAPIGSHGSGSTGGSLPNYVAKSSSTIGVTCRPPMPSEEPYVKTSFTRQWHAVQLAMLHHSYGRACFSM